MQANLGASVARVTKVTHRSQSTARMRAALSGSSPTATNTMTSVKNPACGTPAAPMLARVAVMLHECMCKKITH